jgi:serine/threonine protein kinase/tetratricopeptide (TPR) repeat protein
LSVQPGPTAKELFADIAPLPASERSAVLDRACAGEPALRSEVEALLAAFDGAAAQGFMGSPTGNRSTVAACVLSEGPGTRIGPYKLLQQIGEGGFGVVFMAEQTEPMVRRVALKIIKVGMDTRQVIARFEAERQALAMMDHPNIAKVLDAGATATGRPYFVMELVRGEPITAYCDQEKLSVPARLELFTQVCHAVQHAHQKGIIHRDIKPSNILVTVHDGKPVPKVIDFGIAKATISRLTEKTLFTEHRALIGTPEYMSPEQADMGATDIDTRSDIYSLGVLLYELLTGVTPLDAKSLRSAAFGEMQRIIREEEPQTPSTRLSTLESLPSVAAQRHVEPKKLGTIIRGDLDWIVMKCLEKERSRRYDTANGLAADVQRHLSGQAVNAAPPSRGYRVRKFMRRNRGAVLVTMVVLVLVVTGVTGTTAGFLQARRRAAEEHQARADAEKISSFQAKMLAAIDPPRAGVFLADDLRQRFRDNLALRGVPEQEASAQIEAFGAGIHQVNTADVAADVIDSVILRNAVTAIDREFPDQPGLRALLQRKIADAYVRLGLYKRALPLRESALSIVQGEFGEDNEATLGCLEELGGLYRDLGRRSEGEPLIRKALKGMRRLKGPNAPETLTIMNNLALFVIDTNPAEAERLLREALEAAQRRSPADPGEVFAKMCNLSRVLIDQRKVAEAEPLVRTMLETSHDLDPSVPSRAALEEAAHLAAVRRDYEAVLRYQQQVFESSVKELGREHANSLRVEANLAQALWAAHRLKDAEQHFRALIEPAERVHGASSDIALAVRFNLGVVLKDEGELDAAEPILRRARDDFSRYRPGASVLRSQVALALADALDKRKNPREAEQMFQEAVQLVDGKEGAQHALGCALISLGDHWANATRFQDAIPVLERGCDLIRQSQDVANLRASLERLAPLYAVAREFDKAAARGREAMQCRRNLNMPIQLADTGNLAAIAYALVQLRDKAAAVEAEPILRECLALRAAAYPPGHKLAWGVSNMKSVLGESLLEQSRFADAEPLLLEGYAGLVGDPNVPPPGTLGIDRNREALERIIRLYEDWDKAEPGKGYDAKAAEWKAKLDALPAPDGVGR